MVKVIHTYNPEQEIWHYIDKLTNRGYVHKLLNYRISNGFFNSAGNNIFGINITKINEAKKDYVTEVYEPLTNSDDENISEIIIDAKQSHRTFQSLN